MIGVNRGRFDFFDFLCRVDLGLLKNGFIQRAVKLYRSHFFLSCGPAPFLSLLNVCTAPFSQSDEEKFLDKFA